MVASNEEDNVDTLPDTNFASEFYAKYEVKEILGRGGCSTVRRCFEKATHKEYAVKIIDLTQEKDNEELTEQFREETKKEMNILRMCCAHPNIIELHDTFESVAFIFLVFEICKKGELFDYLTEVVTLSEKRTRAIMRQLLQAVEYIHSKHIVHRDLKPENILMDDNFNVKLSDFGFSTFIEDDEELFELLGTPNYMAPEAYQVSMYQGDTGYGRPFDMWSAGVIMYTLLVGCPPFWHRKQLIMIRNIMEGKYSFSSPEWDDVGNNAKDLVSKLLVIDPKERLTATAALAHNFFKKDQRKELEFLPKRKFRATVYVILTLWRLRLTHSRPPTFSLDQMGLNPYGMKQLRKAIDGGAFKIYGHWVKKGDNQNRAALFENAIKRDIKVNTTSTESSARHFNIYAPMGVVSDRVGRDKLQPAKVEKPPLSPNARHRKNPVIMLSHAHEKSPKP